jgi:hypothetical protein
VVVTQKDESLSNSTVDLDLMLSWVTALEELVLARVFLRIKPLALELVLVVRVELHDDCLSGF